MIDNEDLQPTTGWGRIEWRQAGWPSSSSSSSSSPLPAATRPTPKFLKSRLLRVKGSSLDCNDRTGRGCGILSRQMERDMEAAMEPSSVPGHSLMAPLLEGRRQKKRRGMDDDDALILPLPSSDPCGHPASDYQISQCLGVFGQTKE